MFKPLCYYAHVLALYGTPQELRDITTLSRLGFEVMNPNDPKIQKACDDFRALHGAVTEVTAEHKSVMYEIFKPIVQGCDALAFRALPDGTISSGVVKEIEMAREISIPVIELPSAITRRALSLSETREYLREVGQR